MRALRGLSFILGILLVTPSTSMSADKKKEEAVPEAAVPAAAIGEQQCEAEIFYLWEPALSISFGDSPSSATLPANGTPPANGAPSNDAAPPTTIGASAPIEEEHFSKAHSSAATETDAKERLDAEIGAQRRLAAVECSRRHENLGECIASHISLPGSEFVKLDFETRRMLRDQFKTDCERLEGRCKGTKAGEAKCRAVLGETPPPAAPTGEKAQEKKGEKGKK